MVVGGVQTSEPSDVFLRYCVPGGRYKKLIGGNFIRTLAGQALLDFGRALARDARSISIDEMSELMQGDWRERLTGGWLAGFSQREELRDEISALLLAGGEPYAAKGYVFALARFGSAADGLALRRYLDKYLHDAEFRADQPYAMGALLFVDRRLGTDFASGLLDPEGAWVRWASVAEGSRPSEQDKRVEIETWCDFADACMRGGS
ncbi:DUF6000 family protein [Micromonospora zamorensis]|uniref:DUF6000 family protein n=1 Tax=Micromonospora zamorensis TaxID=709883 RepID=UPI0033A9CFB6